MAIASASYAAIRGALALPGANRLRGHVSMEDFMPKPVLLVVLALAACGGSSSVSSEDAAQRVYFGLDRAVDRALNLGMDGYNAAQSANIPPQIGDGDVSGTLTVDGQVDQGVSSNKELRLTTAFARYSDTAERPDGGMADAGPSGLVYDTAATALPALDLSLRNIPTGTFSGTLNGSVDVSGDLKGSVTLALSFDGALRSAGGSAIGRVPGSTHVTGTATSEFGTYMIDLMH